MPPPPSRSDSSLCAMAGSSFELFGVLDLLALLFRQPPRQRKPKSAQLAQHAVIFFMLHRVGQQPLELMVLQHQARLAFCFSPCPWSSPRR